MIAHLVRMGSLFRRDLFFAESDKRPSQQSFLSRGKDPLKWQKLKSTLKLTCEPSYISWVITPSTQDTTQGDKVNETFCDILLRWIIEFK